MATFIDAAVIGHFSSLFVFLFILVVVYAVLTLTGILGENKSLSAIVALALAVLFAASSTATRVFELAAPWFVLLFLVVFLILLIAKFTGSEDLIGFKKNVVLIVVLIIMIIAIFGMALGQVNKEKKAEATESGEIDENTESTFSEGVMQTLRHPSVLGLIVVLLIAVFAVLLLGANPSK